MPPQADPPREPSPPTQHVAALDAQGALDSATIAAIVRGEKQAFAMLVERYQGSIYGFLRARLLQPNDAEDLTQEVFLRCFRFRDRIQVSASLRPWLLGIARNVLSEYVRRNKRRKEVAWTRTCLELDKLVEAEPEPATPQQEMADQLPACLDGLATSARQAIELRYDNRLPLAEIGQKLRRSEGAARLLMFRARQALKNCLTSKSGDTPHEDDHA
jgi:RNA polymerase sigma-70 factor (ECF subfamily)